MDVVILLNAHGTECNAAGIVLYILKCNAFPVLDRNCSGKAYISKVFFFFFFCICFMEVCKIILGQYIKCGMHVRANLVFFFFFKWASATFFIWLCNLNQTCDVYE